MTKAILDFTNGILTVRVVDDKQTQPSHLIDASYACDKVEWVKADDWELTAPSCQCSDDCEACQ
jgi:hypothetical protein